MIRDQAVEGVFSRARGELIAVTEMGRAYGAGQYGQVEEYRARFPDLVIEKMWLTARDEKVRETHQQNEDDGWIPFDAIFSGTR
jgi:hypothetical protein